MNSMKRNCAIGIANGTILLCSVLMTAACDENGAPPLSEEDQQVVAAMEAGTLATIELGDSRIVFIETVPGEVTIAKNFPMEAEVPTLENEDEMTLVEIFKAYAPDQEVPRALVEAMDRVIDAEIADAETTEQEDTPAESFGGIEPDNSETGEPGVVQGTDALTSSISQTWFVNNFCGFAGTDYDFCFTTAWQGAYGTKKSHRNDAVLCGDTGATRMRVRRGGSTRLLLDVGYRECWLQGRYHHSHNWLGSAQKTTINVSVDWAESTVRFAGYFMDNDDVAGVSPGFIY